MPLEFDVIHCHHWPLAQHLASFRVLAPIVFGFLGVIPALENPPPLAHEPKHLWWCVSQEVQNNVVKIDGWSGTIAEPLLIRNWAMPNSLSVMKDDAEQTIKRIVLVSNHFPEAMLRMLLDICRELGISVDRVGLPDRHKLLTPADLAGFDAVVSIGRTVVTAMALRKPTLILDVHGSDGWLTPENYDAVSSSNFSGRHLRWYPNAAELKSLLLSPPNVDQINRLAEKAEENHALDKALDAFEGLYRKAKALGKTFDGFGRELETLTDGYKDLLINAYGERDLLLGEKAALVGERDVLLGEKAALVGERDVLLGEKAALVAERHALVTSVTWRYTAFARKIAEKFRA
jgi:hypothetical protein